MADHQLHGDGINFAFFDMLWEKCSEDGRSSTSEQTPPILRVPDTVVFLFGLPHQWYFTSKNGGSDRSRTSILRKRRANLTLDNIEDVFLTKSKAGKNDIVAYFISSKTESTNTRRDTPTGRLDACSDVVGSEITCNIEYFNKDTLRDFLLSGRNNKSGILQRFVAPHGMKHNSAIRAIWTPKMCLLERRRTKQGLSDSRFALFERAITFDGPEVYSLVVPLRGTVLAGRVEKICDEIVKHITDVLMECSHGNNHHLTNRGTYSNSSVGVGRMIINFKIDGSGKIWILWSNSIRLESDSDGKHNNVEATGNQIDISSSPLNMNTLVKLSSATKLSQVPSHNTHLKLENKVAFTLCPSCNKHGTNETFQLIPYKTVILHFTKTMDMLKSHPESHPTVAWPPEARFIRAAGGVGFGSLPGQLDGSEETFIIPPIIRQINPKLRTKAYHKYRSDAQFLQKTCDVCEDCFLAYARLRSISFVMVYPINPSGSNDKDLQYTFPTEECTVESCNTSKKYASDRSSKNVATIDRFDFKEFEKCPAIPPAIIEPPQERFLLFICLVMTVVLILTQSKQSLSSGHGDSTKNITSLKVLDCFPDVGIVNTDLAHMVDLNRMLANAKKNRRKATTNPYEENLMDKLR